MARPDQKYAVDDVVREAGTDGPGWTIEDVKWQSFFRRWAYKGNPENPDKFYPEKKLEPWEPDPTLEPTETPFIFLTADGAWLLTEYDATLSPYAPPESRVHYEVRCRAGDCKEWKMNWTLLEPMDRDKALAIGQELIRELQRRVS